MMMMVVVSMRCYKRQLRRSNDAAACIDGVIYILQTEVQWAQK